LAISVALDRPTCPIDAVDRSEGAIDVARDNALRLGAYNVRWMVGDLFAPLDRERSRYDLVTANPPYIPDSELSQLSPDIRDFEPRMALVGGPDGLEIIRRIVREAPRYLRPGGVLALEVGTGQSGAVLSLLAEVGFEERQTRKDYGGHERVVSGRVPPAR
jgi:release factor glutamine methyltransferase